MNANNPEFIKAWNNFSAATLHLLQVACGDNNVNSVINTVVDSLSNTSLGENTIVESVKQSLVTKKVTCVQYAGSPYEFDGGYVFKRLKDESAGRFYEVTTYSDDSCAFKLICNIDQESLQNLKDCQSQLLPAGVANTSGEITSNSIIVIKKEGVAVVEGKVIKVIEPMEVSFETIE